MFFEIEGKITDIINLLNTFVFQADLSTISHNLPLQIPWTEALPQFSTLNI